MVNNLSISLDGKKARLVGVGSGRATSVSLPQKPASGDISKISIKSSKAVDVSVDGNVFYDANGNVFDLNVAKQTYKKQSPNPDLFLYNKKGEIISINIANQYSGVGDLSIEEYLDNGYTEVTEEIESIFMYGGCCSFAIALQEKNPKLQPVINYFEYDGDYDLNDKILDNAVAEHVFLEDPITKKCYDIRGEFKDRYALESAWDDDPGLDDVVAFYLKDLVDPLSSLLGEEFRNASSKDLEITRRVVSQLNTRDRV